VVAEVTERKRGGQPRTGKPARNRLVVLLDDDEWDDLQVLAKAVGMNRSDYVRERALNETARAMAAQLRGRGKK
jgi:hypothetical protein